MGSDLDRPKSGSLSVLIIARIPPGMHGGIEQAIQGTVKGLGDLASGNEEYLVATDSAAPDWLQPFVGSNTRVVAAPTLVPPSQANANRIVRRVTNSRKFGAPLRRLANRLLREHVEPPTELAGKDPFVEGLNPDVVHFPYQTLHATTAPAVFNPQDLQHLHRPEFFEEHALRYRTAAFALYARAATAIEVPSHSTKRDLVELMGVKPGKILVVPKASPTLLYPSQSGINVESIRSLYSLPEKYFLYPAQTWPHKNHLRLLEAIAKLRDRRQIHISLVCIGRLNEYGCILTASVRALNLDSQVRFLGLVPTAHVRPIYQASECVVFPTLFEGGGLPILEAFSEQKPLACSDIGVLREQARDAALYFDPTDVDNISNALMRMQADAQLRLALVEKGKARAALYTWERTARTYRALYRRLAGRSLCDEDTRLLADAYAPEKDAF